jgi:hypothetical protein
MRRIIDPSPAATKEFQAGSNAAILPMNRQNSARSWSAAAPCRFGKSTTRESGRGLPHSKTLTRHRMFMGRIAGSNAFSGDTTEERLGFYADSR